MAADFISIIRDSKDATHAQQLLSAVETVRSAKAQIEKLSTLATRMFGGEDFALFETKMGIPSGQGKTVFTIIGQVNELFSQESVLELINRIG